MDYIRAIERQQIREDMPRILVGDNVKVHYRIKEGEDVYKRQGPPGLGGRHPCLHHQELRCHQPLRPARGVPCADAAPHRSQAVSYTHLDVYKRQLT